MKNIYLDHAATTYVKKEVLDDMIPYFTQNFGNPSSVYGIAQINKDAVDRSRKIVANALNANEREIYFTSGGSESDNWAIKGVASRYKNKGNHIITSKIEHHAVLHTCQYLEKNGYEVTYLDVDEYGSISIEQLKESIREDTILITIMFANNEIGTIQDIKEIGSIARERGIIFHTDAVQAVGHVDVDVVDMNIDMLSLSGHKFYGPKGVGALYIRKGIVVDNLIHGGAQEKRKRAGTENVAGIVGLAKALEIAIDNLEENNKKMIYLRDKFINGVEKNIPNVKLNGHREKRLPANANITFDFIEGESILLSLEAKGICASSGSACTSGSLDPSHVLLGIGLPHERAHGSLRISLGEENTEEEIDYLLNELPPIIQRLRDMSPLYEDYIKNNK